MAQLTRPITTLAVLSHFFHHPRPRSAFIFRQSSRLGLPTFYSSRPKHHPFRLGLGFDAVRRNFCVRAANGFNDSNLIQSMEKKIKEHLTAESVTVTDAYGDGRHVSIDVVSTAFEGQSAVNRQRMVYKAIWEELQNTVHAVDQMTTRTPGEADATK